ncbi:hypothetical protein AMECASPLE_006338 [Ameca splendens]|uniref:Uncharacterized protein n=1 Tax=Ameca splendens TaxID=208324 RepID=A0ABV0XZD6_9TELE
MAGVVQPNGHHLQAPTSEQWEGELIRLRSVLMESMMDDESISSCEGQSSTSLNLDPRSCPASAHISVVLVVNSLYFAAVSNKKIVTFVPA